MRAPGWKTAIVSSLIAAMLLTSCSTRTSPTAPNANGDGPTVDTASAAVDIADINVRAWVRAEAQMPAVTLGNITSQEVDPDAPQRVVELTDGTKQVTCNVDGVNDDIYALPPHGRDGHAHVGRSEDLR